MCEYAMKTKTQPPLLMLELLFKLYPPRLNQPPHYLAHALGTRWYVPGGRVSKDISAFLMLQLILLQLVERI